VKKEAQKTVEKRQLVSAILTDEAGIFAVGQKGGGAMKGKWEVNQTAFFIFGKNRSNRRGGCGRDRSKEKTAFECRESTSQTSRQEAVDPSRSNAGDRKVGWREKSAKGGSLTHNQVRTDQGRITNGDSKKKGG